MRYKYILIYLICFIVLFSTPASSKSPFLNIEYYYNDHLITDCDSPETPKPLLKVGEPFKLRFELTCYKRNYLSVQLWSIGNDDFVILEGPTSLLGTGTRGTIEENETRIFEWTVAPTEEWAGGIAPINFYYQMTDLERPITITSGEFTAAYVTISEEHYDGPVTPALSLGQSPEANSSPTIPAFTLPGALAAMCMVYALRRR